MILYRFIILPIEYLIEVIFTLLYRFFNYNVVGALFGVSLTISFLVLPLYLKADQIQEEEQEKQKQMQFWLKHIRRVFQKEERYMMEAAYYKEQGYRPINAIRGAFSLLLQIPFFIAAYHYLSNLAVLREASFGGIYSLGEPDALLHIGSVKINVLPIVMTLINLVSGAIYTKGYTRSQKLQVFILPLVFLALLYQSPAGLVIYWTLNNIFSLCKNIIMKCSKYRTQLEYVVFGGLAVFYIAYLVCGGKLAEAINNHDPELLMIYALVGGIMLLPMLRLVYRKKPKEHAAESTDKRKGKGILAYNTTALAITLLLGGLIPMSVISSSPQDFINIVYYKNPIHFALTTLLAMAGVLLFWGNIVFYLMDDVKKRGMKEAFFGLLVICVFNHFTCNAETGTMSRTLMFTKVPHYSSMIRYGNILIVFVLFVVAVLLRRKLEKLSNYIVAVLTVVILIITTSQVIKAQSEIAKVEYDARIQEEVMEFPLSRNGKNVVVIMLDAAVGAYIPFIMEERPELKEAYDGFTYYPNTISTGLFTNYGSPGLLGGYEYTTAAINVRKEESLEEKHDEAIRVLPVIFGENGYHVTLADVPYAKYQVSSDYSLYDPYPYVNAFHYADHMTDEGSAEATWKKMEHNFFFYSIYRTVPAMFQDNIYDQSNYLSGTGKKAWYSDDLKLQYNALTQMSERTVIRDDAQGEFIYYANMTSHDPSMLALPDYEIVEYFDNTDQPFDMLRSEDGLDININSGVEWAVEYYHVNCAALLRLADWLDYLKQQDVYDNTRIIIVSDHGRELRQFSTFILEDGTDIETANALLMVKDFDSRGFHVDTTFMTNADTPALATQNLIEDAVNPFTGNRIGFDGKADGIDVFWGMDFNLTHGNVFEPLGASWYHVEDNIFISENWTRIGR